MFWNTNKKKEEKPPLILCRKCGGLLHIEKYTKTFIEVSICIRCEDRNYCRGYEEAKFNYQEELEELEHEKECLNKAWEKLANKIKQDN